MVNKTIQSKSDSSLFQKNWRVLLVNVVEVKEGLQTNQDLLDCEPFIENLVRYLFFFISKLKESGLFKKYQNLLLKDEGMKIL